jgi:hypothetical protein
MFVYVEVLYCYENVSPGLQIIDIEPFCQYEIVVCGRCAEQSFRYICLSSDSGWWLCNHTKLHITITDF